MKIRPDVAGDIEDIVSELSEDRPDYIYGEALHIRGSNIKEVEIALDEEIKLYGFDLTAEKIFYSILNRYGFKGRWWREISH